MADGAGSAIYLNNHMKLSRHADVSAHQREMRGVSDEIKASVFARTQEFTEYHKSRRPPPESTPSNSVSVRVEGIAEYDDVGTFVRVVNKDNPDEWVELNADFDTDGVLEFRVVQGPSVRRFRLSKNVHEIPVGRYDDFNPGDYDRSD